MLKDMNKITEKTEYLSQHCPMSYVICDSEVETLSRCHEKPKELITMSVRDVLKVRKKLGLQMTEDFQPILDDFNVIFIAAQLDMQDMEENGHCQNIKKEENPVDYKIAELSNIWAKQL